MSVPGSRTASPPRSAPQAKKRAPRAPATHPPYVEMVRSAIASLKERGGSSRQKIASYIQANYEVGNEQTRVNARLRTALKSGVEKGVLLRSANSKGTGANGSFRVGKALPKKKPKKAAAKKGRSRVTKKRRSPKKSPRKSAAKKSAGKRKPKKAARKPAKKARKSPAKKAKRSPKKKAAARRPKSKAAKGKARR